MEKLIITGGKKLIGSMSVSGSKNAALKAMVAACLTNEEVVIENMPLITDFTIMKDIIEELGGKVRVKDHTVYIKCLDFKKDKIFLDKAAEIRTSFMFLAPLLARKGSAIIPNPGGCRIGARPIDRVVDGLEKMNVRVNYISEDGYFHAAIGTGGLIGASYKFSKNTHTGTEALILTAVLAKGKTVLENAAQEPEVDELIEFLNKMGARIKRTKERTIVIEGVKKLHGVKFRISPDRNEIVTFAAAAILTEGDVFIKDITRAGIEEFLIMLEKCGGGFKEEKNGIRFYYKGELTTADIVTQSYPGFMTDWQGPWAVLMTRSNGLSTIHETIYENRFNYVSELIRMGAEFELFNPKVPDSDKFYNFNINDDKDYFHALKIKGPVKLHNAVVHISDLRAGATLVLAALTAKGYSVIFGLEYLDRGYENFEGRLRSLGAIIERVNDE